MNLQWQRYPQNAHRLFKLTVPIFISQLSASGMGLADIVMAGLVSDDDVSAIAVSNSIYFPLFLFVLGLLNAITPTVSYLNGSNQRHLIAHQIRQGFWLVLALSAPLIIIFLNSNLILDYMQTPASFSLKSQQYLAIMSLGVIPALLAINLRCMNDGLSNPTPAMRITFFGLLLNIPLNYIFIFGKLGMPEMGAVGCGVATVIVNWVMFLLMLHYSYTHKSQRDIGLFNQWFEKPSGQTLLKICKLGLPIGFATFTEVMLFSTSSLLLSPLGAQVVASHQAALQTSSIFFMIPMSFSIATTIVIGQTLGQKLVEEAKVLSYHALLTGFIFAILAAIVIILFNQLIPLAFTRDTLSISIAAHLLLFAAVYQIPDALQAVANGILRGYKHTKPILFVTLFCYWIVGMPLGFILARTNWLVEPMAAAGFWFTFCVCLSLASGLLIWQMVKIHRIPAEQLIRKLEKIK
ncbi:MATE family efflux transporter [Actinobacillus minor]|uniref:MATE family efflux transporter n=1 Tax=Actinobacillus minor TaxID=51047 RepID=UPI0023F550F0|nr:MATE family efflux transporter [Actinobacillus minor]MDD6909901.1 MATE family efflux transporter [Actinobacillus minor]MDY4713810.1 MATE family efflux transporter [Actinobacillus minor]